MKAKTKSRGKEVQRIELPPGVNAATTEMSPALLADVMSDIGIASGGRHAGKTKKRSA